MDESTLKLLDEHKKNFFRLLNSRAKFVGVKGNSHPELGKLFASILTQSALGQKGGFYSEKNTFVDMGEGQIEKGFTQKELKSMIESIFYLLDNDADTTYLDAMGKTKDELKKELKASLTQLNSILKSKG